MFLRPRGLGLLNGKPDVARQRLASFFFGWGGMFWKVTLIEGIIPPSHRVEEKKDNGFGGLLGVEIELTSGNNSLRQAGGKRFRWFSKEVAQPRPAC